MKRKWIVVLAMLLMFVVSFSACGKTNSELQDIKGLIEAMTEQIENLNGDIDELEQKAEEGTQEFNELKGEIGSLEEQIQSLKERIQVLEETSALYQKQIENLSGEEIEFTAQAPVYSFFLPKKEQVIASFDGPFEEFHQYYVSEIEQKQSLQFYLVNPDPYEDSSDPTPLLSKDYSYISSEEENLPMVIESMRIYNEVLGDANFNVVPIEETYTSISVMMYLILVPLPEGATNVSRQLELEFGRQENTESMYKDGYINLYWQDTCIGTCYYNVNCYISRTWFEIFFKNPNKIQ